MVRKLVTGALVALCGMIAIAPHTYAQDSINLEEVRKELQSARASANNNKVPPSQDSFTGDESDIQKRRASLLAAENALLDELQGSGPVGGSSPKGSTQGMIPPKSAVSAVPPSAPIAEREIPVLKENVLSVHKSEPVAEKIVPAVAPVIKSEKSSIREVAVVPSTLGDLEKIKSATSAIEGELSALRKSNAELVSQLKSTKSRSSSLQRDLEETRDRLMIAESEVERLSGAMKTRSQEALVSLGATTAPAVQKVEKQVVKIPQVAPIAAVKREPRVAEDILVGTVVAEKANLRTGPGKDNSPFMTVPKGARLTVETRRGDWYRVITPTGTRAWVASEVLAFGETSQGSPTRTVRIKGYDSSLEDESFKIANSTGSN